MRKFLPKYAQGHITLLLLIIGTQLQVVVAQDFILEREMVPFGSDSLHDVVDDQRSIDYALGDITDNRSMPSNVVAIAQDKKFLVRYFDVYYTLPDSLPAEIEQAFEWNERAIPVSLNIERFRVSGFSKKNPLGTGLYSQVTIAVPTDSGTFNSGTLVNEISYRKPFPFKSKTLSNSVPIEDWKVLFSEDLNTLAAGRSPYNFYPTSVRSNLIARSIVHVGLKTLIVDGELWFAHPESQRNFTASPFAIRYRNAPDFESIGFKVKNSYSYHRLNDNFLVISRISAFIGINRWKSFDEMKLGFQHIPHLNISFSQGLVYQSKFNSGIVAGIGITEDVVGIIDKKILFDPALFIMLGVKI